MRVLEGDQVLVRIFIGESDRWHHQPLWVALLERLRREGFAGATVLRGIAGFGASSVVHTAHLLTLSADLPIIIEVVDTEDRMTRLEPILDEMVRSGLVTKERVHVMSYAANPHRAEATLAGGCFWGVEELFRQLPGVIDTTVGYTGGTVENPTYEQVKSGTTGHAEAIRIIYDPTRVSYEAILDYFFRLHDPTTPNRQGPDVGSQYRSAIFYHDEEQRRIAERVVKQQNKAGLWKGRVTTEVAPASTFYPAEEYHQDYLQKNPEGYSCHYIRG